MSWRTTSTMLVHPGGPSVAPWPMPCTGPAHPKYFVSAATPNTVPVYAAFARWRWKISNTKDFPKIISKA
eukprot:15366466-Ditylum_brightwellii.AAC.2